MDLRPIVIATFVIPASLHAGDFKRDIAPILKAKCYSCHSEEAKKEKSGYVFDNLERLKSDIGPKSQIVPGDPDNSPIMDLLTAPDGDDRRMPPNNKDGLTPKEIKAFREWIAAGANLEKVATARPSGLAPRPAAAPVQKWISNDNVTIEASFVSLENDVVVLKQGRKIWRVPIGRLSADSQAQAKSAAGPAKSAK